MSTVLGRIAGLGIIPVVVIDREEDARPLGAALLEAGLDAVEVTYRTASAGAAISTLAESFPRMLVGAGTVLSVETAREAVGRGASFIVSPGLDERVVEDCQARDVPVFPGALTPTEIAAAASLGVGVVKFFPAEAAGGIDYLAAISAPFPEMKFIPTGGIAPSNLERYLRFPAVVACGGSWMVKRETISAGKFGEITRLASEALQAVSQARSPGAPPQHRV